MIFFNEKVERFGYFRHRKLNLKVRILQIADNER